MIAQADMEKFMAVIRAYQAEKRAYDAAEGERRAKKTQRYSLIFLAIVIAGVAYWVWSRSDARFLEICRFGSLEDVRTALEKGIWDVGYTVYDTTPLISAVKNNPDPKVSEFLIQSGAKVNVTDSQGKSALIYASEKGNLDVVKALIASGADVNPDSYSTPLKAAVDNGNAEIVKVLLNAGADPNKGNPLPTAARDGNLEIVKTLIAAKADVNASDYSDTPLKAAARGGNGEVVKALLNAGAKDEIREVLRYAHAGAKDVLGDVIRSRRAPTEYEIISVARKYGFDIINNKGTTFTDNKTGRKIKAIAEMNVSSGCVWFCTERVIWNKGYWIFSPDSYYGRNYSDFRNNPDADCDNYSIRRIFSDELKGDVLDKTVDVFRELVY